jgi:hypothetical protein
VTVPFQVNTLPHQQWREIRADSIGKSLAHVLEKISEVKRVLYSVLYLYFPLPANKKSFIPAKPLSSNDDLTRIALALVSNALCQSSTKFPDQSKAVAYDS